MQKHHSTWCSLIIISIDNKVATLARRIYPSTSAILMKQFEQATSYPYGHLVIDLKSDTPEKDSLHIEIFDRAKSSDEKIAVGEGSIDSNGNEEEDEEGGEDEEEEREGGLQRMDEEIFTPRASRAPKAKGPYDLFC